MEELMSLKGQNGVISVYEDRVVLSRSGLLAAIAQGAKGDRTYFYSDLSGVEYKKPGMGFNGYLKFIVAGTASSNINVTKFSSFGDENTLVLKWYGKSSETDEVYSLIMSKISAAKRPQPQTVHVSAPVSTSSSADEILKYKQLLDAGAITSEEFEAKKKQLLGL